MEDIFFGLFLISVILIFGIGSLLHGGNQTVTGNGAPKWQPPTVGSAGTTKDGRAYTVVAVKPASEDFCKGGWFVTKKYAAISKPELVARSWTGTDCHRSDGTIHYHNVCDN